MAGTPTPNYQFPTYAETDTPNLAGAYNQAVNAIDAKIKEVADSVSTGGDVPDATSTTKGIAKLYDSTTVGTGDQDDGGITPKAVDDKIGGSLTGYAPKFTATAPITYSDNQIGIRYSNPAADGSQNGYGAVQVTGRQQDVASANSFTTATVPNVKAVKDYVDAKVPMEQQAYTGTAPIVVDNGSHVISVSDATPPDISLADKTVTPGTNGVMNVITFSEQTPETTVAAIVDGTDGWPATAWGRPPLNRTTLNVRGIQRYVDAHTPDASTSVKGLVQLTTSPSSSDTTQAVTGQGIYNYLLTRRTFATQQVTVDMLKNLYVDSTGVVFYKAQTE